VSNLILGYRSPFAVQCSWIPLAYCKTSGGNLPVLLDFMREDDLEEVDVFNHAYAA